MDPTESRALLQRVVIIASVTRAEQRRLGGICTHHEDLYRRMLKAHVSRLPRRGMERYSATGRRLQSLGLVSSVPGTGVDGVPDSLLIASPGTRGG
jgi:hypothetical protein